MFRLNLKIAWRNLWKNKTYTFINIFGLSIGMAGCMLIYIFISYQLSFDKGYEHSDRIYRFVTNWKYPGYQDYSKGVPVPMVDAAKNELSGIEKSAVVIKRGGIIHIKDASGKEKLKSRVVFYFAEPQFFEIFSRKWIEGQAPQALSAPNSVALSEQRAIKYFGSAANAMGKSLSIGTALDLKVTGVFQNSPQNTSIPLDIVLSYSTFNSKKYISWDGVNSSIEFYVRLREGQSEEQMAAPIAAFNKKHYADTQILGNQKNTLQPLKEIHFDQRYGSFAETSVSKKEIFGLGLIGLFLMLTACINFINLATAQATNRSKEVGVRKVMGSKRRELLLQFLTETFVITAIAMLLAIILTELSIPAMTQLLQIPENMSLLNPLQIGFMILLVLLVSFLAGFYPAMIMSGFSPVLAIKNKVSMDAGGLGLRKILVVLQFSITSILLIATLFIMKQMAFVREKPLGFNAEAVAMINLPSDSLSQMKYPLFKTKAMQIPGVQLISFCQNAPSSENITSSDFSYQGKKNEDFELRNVKGDENYFKLFDLQLIAGRPFQEKDELNRAVVNQTFLQRMGITDPESAIGQVLNANGADMLITGVVKDYNDVSLKENISPLVIYPQKGEYYSIAVKLESTELMAAMQEIESLFNRTFTAHVYESSFLKEDLNGYYESERVMGVLFKIAAAVIIFISLIGLFGLISFIAAQRTREVAIRKVLGASTAELVNLLNSSFIKMVLLANLLAWPLAYLFISKWLEGFAYRIEIGFWPFVYAFCASMLITILTVSIKSYRTAVANTIDALKYE